MGYLLYREVKVWAPRTLTKGEKLAALVLADNADDRSRETRDSVVDPELMEEAMVPDERSMRRIIARLQEEQVIKNIVAGHNGRTAKFLILKLAPAGWIGTTGYRKRSDVGGQNSPAYEPDAIEAGAENHPPTDDVAGCFSASSRVKTTLPRPPTKKTTTTPADPSASPAPEGGGGGQRQDEQQAEGFLQSLPGPWAAGRATASKLAPLLLERIAEMGWQLDGDLARWLSRDLGPVRTTHASVLRVRIDDLPKKPSTKSRDSPNDRPMPPWCEHRDCDEITRRRTTEDHEGHRSSSNCRTCHPDHYEDQAA